MSSTYTFRGMTLPQCMKESLDAYIESGRPTGDFLRAVIDNDLRAAFGRADADNQAVLPAFVAYLYNHAPTGCWGFQGAHNAWVLKQRAERQNKTPQNDPTTLSPEIDK